MKKYLEKMIVFERTLRIFSFLAKREIFNRITYKVTSLAAQLNIQLNKPQESKSLEELAKTWKQMMPPDGQDYFKTTEIKDNTAFAEIHLHCPLRGTGDVKACHRLMNYDRQLMQKIGGQLVVLESQSNSGKTYCRLAIRKQEDSIGDLIPAHKNLQTNSAKD